LVAMYMPTNNNQLRCGFKLVAWALLGNHSSTITVASGYNKSTLRLWCIAWKKCWVQQLV